MGSGRSPQLAVASEVSVTNGEDSAGEAAHRRRRGRGILEDSYARSQRPVHPRGRRWLA